MRILFLTQVLPYPLDAGPKTRAYYVLRYLAQTHDVTLVSFVRATDTQAAVDHLRQYCTSVHTVPIVRSRMRDVGFLAESMITNQPFVITRDRSQAMQALLADIVGQSEHFDAVHADQLWMAPYVQYVHDLVVKSGARQGAQAGTRPPLRVLDQHNAVYMIFHRLADAERNAFMKMLARQEAGKVARYEAEICAELERVAWVTREDLDAVATAAKESRAPKPVVNSGIIPICIDTGSQPALTRAPHSRRVTFLGGLHYPPNSQGVLWFAEHIFPKVLAQAPDAILTIIGKQPPAELANFNIPPANLEVMGYVDDPKPLLEETAAFIVPLLAGGGMRVKILDAWCWGVPIVSTTIGAEGIATTHGQDILIADDPAGFAEQVVCLLQDPVLNTKIAAGGRRSAEQLYDWRTVYRAWDAVYAVSDL
jgi:glycosyltransferase involved in cell wall biosynthesis